MVEKRTLRPSTFRKIITDLPKESENIKSVDIQHSEMGPHLVTANLKDRKYHFLIGLHKDLTKIVAILPLKQVSPDIRKEAEQQHDSLLRCFDRDDSKRYVKSTQEGMIFLISEESIFDKSTSSYIYEEGFVEAWLNATLKSIQEADIDYEAVDEVGKLVKLLATVSEKRELLPPILPSSF